MKHITPAAQVAVYLVLVFLAVGIIAWIYIGRDLSMAEVPWIFVVGSFSPTVAAVVTSVLSAGGSGVAGLFSRWKVSRGKAGWLWIALSPFAAAAFGAVIYHAVLGGGLRGVEPPSAGAAAALVLTAMVVGALGEETGWRGFMLPKLQEVVGPVVASAVLGCAWWLFHLPLWFIRDSGYSMPIWMFGLIIVSVTWMMTLAFNFSGGSIVPGYILHASFNLSGTLTMSTGLIPYVRYFPLMCVVYPALAIVLTVAVLRDRVARDRVVRYRGPGSGQSEANT